MFACLGDPHLIPVLVERDRPWEVLGSKEEKAPQLQWENMLIPASMNNQAHCQTREWVTLHFPGCQEKLV